MLKTLLGVVLEILVAVAVAGLILALVVPLLHRSNLVGTDDVTARAVIIGVLLVAVAVAIFRPGSATHRLMKR